MVTCPSDWQAIKLKEVGYLKTTSINPQKYADVLFWEYSMPSYDKDGKPSLVYGETMHSNRFIIDCDVILFNKLNVRQKRVWLVENVKANSVCSMEFLPFVSHGANLGFLKQLFISDDFINHFMNISSGTSNSQQRITPKDFLEQVIIIPTEEEQSKIAQTLLAFDEHIDNLTECIEKKKAIRDGALEDLVSGKTRLDGFGEKWDVIPFRQYFTLLPTNTYSREQLSDSGTIGNIHYGDILIKYGCVLSENDYIPKLIDVSKVNPKQYLNKNDVIIADTAEDETVGKAVQISDISIPLVSGLHTMACRPNYPTAEGFLGYYINSNCYHDQILPYITGIKVSSISKKSIAETELHIPKNIKEQQAIVEVLTAMDEEIEFLEEEKTKLMQIREGAMDDLLTGRVRLKV